MKLELLLKDDNLLQIFSDEELASIGFGNDLLAKLKEDTYQADNPNGYIGAMVLNFLHREKKYRKKLNGAFVHAYLFAETLRIDFSTLLTIQDKGKPLVVEKEIDGESDLYIPVKDLHLITSSFEDATVQALAEEYYRTRNPMVAQEMATQLEKDLKKITLHLCPRLGIQDDWNTYIPEAYYALIDSMEKWEPGRGASFRTYLFNGIKYKLQRARYENNRVRRREPTILDRPIAKGGDEKLMSLMSDENSPGPLQTALDDELAELIQQDIGDAPERVRPMLVAYFFGGKTLEELGDEFGGLTREKVTREMARQIMKPVLTNPCYFKRTRKYFGNEQVINLDLVSDLD